VCVLFGNSVGPCEKAAGGLRNKTLYCNWAAFGLMACRLNLHVHWQLIFIETEIIANSKLAFIKEVEVGAAARPLAHVLVLF
jgi:hypothetical protein